MPLSSQDSTFTLLTTDSVFQAAQWLEAGCLLAYPTESVWGIGCDPFNQNAVQQLLSIKQRPVDKGLIVVTDSIARITPLLANLSAEQRQNVADSWRIASTDLAKQAHTWLLPLQNSSSDPFTVPIPAWITGVHHSVAVRVIAHPLIQQLCAQLVSTRNPYGFIVSTSCNPSGQPPALSLLQAQTYFASDNINNESDNKANQPITYLTGDTLGYQLPSQIHDASTGKVLR